MAGFENDVLLCSNVNFNPALPKPHLGLITTNGQLIIGSTALNAGGTHLNIGNLVSADASVSIGYASPNITLSINGSLIPGTITGDTGGPISQSGHNWNIISNVAANNSGKSVSFSGSGSTLTLNVTDSTNNTFIGKSAGAISAGSSECCGFGYLALSSLTTQVFSSAFGAHALENCNADANSAFGQSASQALTSGIQNCAFGQASISKDQTSIGNSAFGYATLFNYLNGSGHNTALGHQSLIGLINGQSNIGIGPSSGINYVGAESSNIVISNAGVASESNVTRIGTQGSGIGQQNKAFIAGIVGVTVSNLNVVTINTATGQLGSQTSSGITGTATQFDVIVGAAGNTVASVGPGTAGQVLQSGGAAANPVYSTATYPLTTTSQQLLYSTATNVVGQLTTANSALAATNSSGTLGMRLFSVVTQVFTVNGTYTPTTGMLYCKVRMVGGGAAGGGAAATGAGQSSVGSGGGSGEYAEATVSAATIGASQTVTIGAGGTANSGATGGNGGNTSLGAIVTANGGSGGITSASAVSGQANGGAGGTGGTGGSFRANGQHGTQTYQIVATSSLIPGDGGNSQFGAGGQGSTAITAGTGSAGTVYGSGGGGSGNTSSLTAKLGGVGTAGIIIIDEYVIA